MNRMNTCDDQGSSSLDRRDFLKLSLSAAAAAGAARGPRLPDDEPAFEMVDNFDRPDGYFHGADWESLNPGFWKIQDHGLRRRLDHRGDDRPGHWFPWHWETHRSEPMPIEYDPSLPFGMIMRRDWKLSGSYTLRLHGTVHQLPPRGPGQPSWKNRQPGYGLIGLAFGSSCLHESWTGEGASGRAAWMAAWRDDGRFGVYDHATNTPEPVREDAEQQSFHLSSGDRFTITLGVENGGSDRVTVAAVISSRGNEQRIMLGDIDPARFTDGYFGIVGRGRLDAAIHEIEVAPGANTRLDAPTNDLHVCYPLGDTLERASDGWRVTFIGLCRSPGDELELRIAQTPDPDGGWAEVPVAGRAPIETNEFRRRTAVIDAVLPADPGETSLYYTVWKDGENVTGDPRIGTDSVGAGTGYIGAVPGDGDYLGRLPQLEPPYRLCGLSCHAITGNRPDLPAAGKYEAWWLHDQPAPEALEHLDDYDFQVMVWEDDVWYLELIFPPPSVDDAYKVITATLGGPTTRWQMMRHWNVINPGDHDHGMDDVKGPEQIIIRTVDNLGQDIEYMRRNFQIVSHLIAGDKAPAATENPRRWRRWKMPRGDFSLLILDGRLWRTSQDTNIWDDEGWGHRENLYDRTNVTRTLLGEEQFAWLQESIRTDSSPLMALTGINGLHTIWQGHLEDPETGRMFYERDRVAADYGGWVKAGADRVLELLGSRQGVISVYGDVHNGCILKNSEHRVYECSFGPIGRTGGRTPKEEFGPSMEDYDGRELTVGALYHEDYEGPELVPNEGPTYWNFLEMVFDPRPADPEFELRVRNLIDAPTDPPRGGGSVEDAASNTGRPPSVRLPALQTLPKADLLVSTMDGQPIRGGRSLADGTVPVESLIDVPSNTRVVITARKGDEAAAEVVVTEGI